MQDHDVGTTAPSAITIPAPTSPADQAGSGDQESQTRYTGVVLIHGLGIIQRNTTLEEVTNALTYWFNHRAGLALRREGTGRVWLSASLTDDPNPDAQPARARMDLVAPGGPTAAPDANTALRLEFREVWWAESIGLPSVGATTRWTRVQFREQAANLLSLFTIRRGDSGMGTYIPAPDEAPPASGESAAASPAVAERGHATLTRADRALLRVALRFYGWLQYLWKALQWLMLVPLVFLLLTVMGLLQVLALVPAFRSTVIAGSTALLNSIMLHWIAEAQIYTSDYTRSAVIRERFELELRRFLEDPLCERIVVVGHSMGTVIAYEGLTNVLPASSKTPLSKPVAFICLAQALRRIWLMTADDPHRLRGVLHKGVRWLHFWARYDPVTAGPLEVRSLPKLEPWPDQDTPDPYPAMCDRLQHCENVAVVNTDATFSDHTTYWQNLEQVVGPVARELVAGHADLEQLVQHHLATTDDIRVRLWSVAWRASLGILGGFAAGIGLAIWSALHPEFGNGLANLLGTIDWAAIGNSICPVCRAIPVPTFPANPTLRELEQSVPRNVGGALLYLISNYLTVPGLLVGLVVLAVIGISMWAIARLVAPPSVFRFESDEVAGALHVSVLFALTSVCIVLVFAASILFSGYVHQSLTYNKAPTDAFVVAFVWVFGIAELVFWVPSLVMFVAVLQRRQWGWLVIWLITSLLVVPFDPFFRSALLAVAVAGCVVFAVGSWRARGWRRNAFVALVALMVVYAGVGTTLFQFGILRSSLLGAGVGVEYLLPLLIYAFWSAATRPAAHATRLGLPRRIAFALAGMYLGLLLALTVATGAQPHQHYAGGLALAGLLNPGPVPLLTLRSGTIALVLLLGGAMLLLAMGDALRTHRWGWLVAIVLLLLLLITGAQALLLLGATSYYPEGGVALSCALVATALSYCLWAGSPRRMSSAA